MTEPSKNDTINEGIMKEHYLIDGEKVDSVLYGMTKNRWKELENKA